MNDKFPEAKFKIGDHCWYLSANPVINGVIYREGEYQYWVGGEAPLPEHVLSRYRFKVGDKAHWQQYDINSKFLIEGSEQSVWTVTNIRDDGKYLLNGAYSAYGCDLTPVIEVKFKEDIWRDLEKAAREHRPNPWFEVCGYRYELNKAHCYGTCPTCGCNRDEGKEFQDHEAW